MDSALRDLLHAVRRLLQRPAFTVTAGLMIALGIGATTSVFSVVDALLLRPLPFREPSTLVQIWASQPSGSMVPYLTYDGLRVWQQETTLFGSVDATRGRNMLLVGGAEPDQVRVEAISGGLMRSLGVPPALGRLIGAADIDEGRNDVIVLSDSLWRGRFGGDPCARHWVLHADGSSASC